MKTKLFISVRNIYDKDCNFTNLRKCAEEIDRLKELEQFKAAYLHVTPQQQTKVKTKYLP